MRFICFFLIYVMLTVHALAGSADVEGVKVTREAAGTYRFDVTIRHQDDGWKHYANKWEVILPSGEVIATRILHHPHVDEQPFTRSLSGVKIPEDIKMVKVRGHDNVHGAGHSIFEVEIIR